MFVKKLRLNRLIIGNRINQIPTNFDFMSPPHTFVEFLGAKASLEVACDMSNMKCELKK